MHEMMNTGALGLAKLRIVDLTRMAPGPFCTMVLGDMGAEVIRVEEPGGGRLKRSPPLGQAEADHKSERRKAAFNALNRNKRSIALNLKSPQAQDILHRMCQNADVFVEGFRPGVVTRLGCDYDTLSTINPNLIYCSISGYGQNGPYSNLVGHDINYISVGGALGLIGPENGAPTIPYNIIADYAAGGMQAVIGILAALIARQHTGRGQYVDIAMSDGVAYMLAAVASNYFADGMVPKRGSMTLNGGVPYYNVYECKDGEYISLGCIEPWFWEALCRALDREDFIPYEFNTDHYQEIFSYFRETFKTRTRDEWWDYLTNAGDIAVAKIYSMSDLFDDPQLRHRKMVEEVGHIDGEAVRHVGIGPKLSQTPGSIRSLGVEIGTHTDDILMEVGFSTSEAALFREKGIVG